jgi:hypothetical protein
MSLTYVGTLLGSPRQPKQKKRRDAINIRDQQVLRLVRAWTAAGPAAQQRFCEALFEARTK